MVDHLPPRQRSKARQVFLLSSEAGPGEILVSRTVRDLARTSAGVEFEDRGEHELKGIAEPQRLFAVRAEGSS